MGDPFIVSMKPHLPVSLLKAIRATVCLSLTVASTGILLPQAQASYDSKTYTLTIENGGNAAIRMQSQTGYSTYNSNNGGRYSREGNISYRANNGYFNTNSGTSLAGKRIESITLNGGGSLYLYDRGSNDDYYGTIDIQNAENAKAVIGTFNTDAVKLQIHALTGSGDVLLRGHNSTTTNWYGGETITTSEFTIVDASGFTGRVFMTANDANVQLNASGEHWSGTVVDFTNAASNSLIDSQADDARGIILNLTNNVTFAGLDNGESSVAKVTGANYTLTVGDTTTNNYQYGGTTDLGALVKTGSNTQSFSTVLNADSIEVKQGTLATLGGTTATRATLEADAEWHVGGTTSISDLSISKGTGTITGTDSKVEWNVPSTITLTDFDPTNGTPLLNLSNLTINMGDSLTLNGYNGTLVKGSVLDFAQLNNATYIGPDSFELNKGGSVLTMDVTTSDGGMLQFTVAEVQLKADLKVTNIAAIYIMSDGLTASGQETFTRTGYNSYTYTETNKGSFNNAKRGSQGSGSLSYWQGENEPTYSGSYNDRNYTTSDGISDTLNVIQIKEGNALYLGGANYKGTVYVRPGDEGAQAVIATYDTATTNVSIANLLGEGDVLLRGNSTSSETQFTIGSTTEFDGTIRMSAPNQAVRLNTQGDALQHAVVDFTPTAYTSVFSSGSASKATLAMKADATVGALHGGSTSNAAVEGEGVTLSIGNDKTEQTYSYGGSVKLSNLTKVGSSTQEFTEHVAVKKLAIEGGTLSTAGGATVADVNLHGGATWQMSGTTEITDSFTLTAGSGTATIKAAEWELPSTINFEGYSADFAGPYITLDGTHMTVGDTLTLTGTLPDFDSIATFDFAELSNGAQYLGPSTITVVGADGNEHLAIAVVRPDNVLQLEFTDPNAKVEVLNGQILWVHSSQKGHAHEGLNNATYNGNYSWSGDTVEAKDLHNILVHGGAEVYMRSGDSVNTTPAALMSNIRIVGDEGLVKLHAENTASEWNFGGQLTVEDGKEGHVMLVAHNSEGSTVFQFTTKAPDENWFSGKLGLSAPNGGTMQLNISDTRWKDTLINLGGHPQGSIYNPGVEGNSIHTVLAVLGDAQIKGLISETESASVATNNTISGNSFNLTIGTDDADSDYEFAGALGGRTYYTGGANDTGHLADPFSLALTKIGSNTQSVGGPARLRSLTQQAGGLNFGSTVTVADAVELMGGTTSVQGAFSSSALTVNKGQLTAGADVTVTQTAEFDHSASNLISGSLTAGHLELNNAELSILEDAHIVGTTEIIDSSLSVGGSLTAHTLNYSTGSLSTGALTEIGTANITFGNSWNLGDDTTVDTLAMSNLYDGNALTLSGGSLAVNNVFTYSGFNQSAEHAWFTLNGTELSFGAGMNLTGVNVTGDTATMTFAELTGTGASLALDGGAIRVTSTEGVRYDGTLRTEGGYVYIDLTKAWPVFVWSGEKVGTQGGSAHGNLTLGNVWRADGDTTNTGWHEQDMGAGKGVFVNGREVTFKDTDMHGDKVEADGRIVNIQGQVAPGTIYIEVNENLGRVGGTTADAQLKFGYAFTSTEDGGGSIVDFDAKNPTSIIKTGKALLVLNTSNTFSGGIDVQDGGLYLGIARAAGTGTLSLHADKDWTYPAWNSQTKNWENIQQHGTEVMVCYTHSDDYLSSFRNPVLTNRIELKDTDGDATNNQITFSFSRSTFNHLNASGSGFVESDVPRHWRNLTLNGTIVGTEGRESTNALPNNRYDTLVLKAYSSTWTEFDDQSYVTSFTLYDADPSKPTTFSGTVKTLNTVNDSLLENDKTQTRTAGTVQVMLSDRKLQYAELDLTRDWVEQAPNGDTDRQSYASILVAHGDVSLRGLSADFLGEGWVYTTTGTSVSRSYNSNLSQSDERWRVRTVVNAETTLMLGQHETKDETYVYSGSMGYAQAYVEPGQGHIRFGNGFDESTSSGDYEKRFGGHSMGLSQMLSIAKFGASNQYIHTASVNDLSIAQGLIGFNNLSLSGNLNITGGSRLSLGVYDGKTFRDIHGTPTVSSPGWTNITSGDFRTSATIAVNSGKTVTVYTPAPAPNVNVPTAAVVDGTLNMHDGSAITFIVNEVEPWWQEYNSSQTVITGHERPSEHMLMTVNGTLNLMADTTKLNINFSGVNFTLTPYSNRMYYLAEADQITVGNSGDSSAFSERLISLGYGYFGMVDTLDSSNSNHNTGGKDYLVMTVMGDPRNTWSGMVDLNGNNFTWEHTDRDKAPDYDYHWKENTAFSNGNVVLFGNLYTPDEWEETKHLTGEQTVRVETTQDSLQPGTVADNLQVNGFSETEKFGKEYQAVEIVGQVAPLSVIVNSEYVDVTNGEQVLEDGTNYYFYSNDNGTIRDANGDELSAMFSQYQNGFEGDSWKTNLEKYGSGTLVIATDNSYSGGTLIQGGRLVMQHENALGTGDITITNGAALQGDFADSTKQSPYDLTGTTTIKNKVYVNTYYDPEDPNYATKDDAYITNAYDKKLVLTELAGENDTVVVLRGTSAAEQDGKYTYAVFKVLDPGDFYGTIRMDGNIWQEREYKYPSPDGQPFGGNVQLDIMTTAKSNTEEEGSHHDWLNATIDLSVTTDFGTNRTVLALDPLESVELADKREYAQVNTITGDDGAGGSGKINSSVLNMSHNRAVTLQIVGLRDGSYKGALGYGDYQVSVDYDGSHAMLGGQAHHHLGAHGIGDLNVLKQGTSTTQSVYDAWINEIKVEAGNFVVDHALVVKDIYAGINPDIETSAAGAHVIVGTPELRETVYALTVGKGGILAMYGDGSLTADGVSGADAWVNVHSGLDNDEDNLAGWVNLENGATVTARSDWQALGTQEKGYDKTLDIDNNATVTFNTHNYSPDEWISTAKLAELRELHANAKNETTKEDLAHFIAEAEKFNYSHIMQFDGKLTGNNVHLIFNNEQMSAGATEEEMGTAEYMGYVAIQDHNTMTGDLQVKDKTVLQVLHSNSAESAMNATINGPDAAMQTIHGKTQYVNNLIVQNGGSLLLGGSEKLSLGTGDNRLKNVDMDGVQMSVSNREGYVGTMSTIHTDTSSQNSYYLGGTSALRSEAEAVHITVHDSTATVNNYVHDINLYNSLVELESSCTVDMGDSVLIDKDSIVYGQGATYFNEDFYSLSSAVGSIEDFELIAPRSMKETAYVSKNTTVEMTFAGDRASYTGTTDLGTRAKVYTVKTDQFQGTNVDNLAGTGLTIKLQQDILGEAWRAGADVIAIQIGGSDNEYCDFENVTGQFMFETTDGVFEMSDAERLMLDIHGEDITASWIDSATLYAQFGIQGSQNMLYIIVPEPATATLSLLALAALAARRRRK